MPGQRKRRCAVTDREKLQLAIRLTTQWEFGQICDFVATLGLAKEQVTALQSKIRTHGNNVIRIVTNHVDSYSLTHKNTSPVDADRIADRLQQKG